MAPKKGKKKGKTGKGKKGKKGKKSEKKLAKELATQQQAAADSELWNARYEALSETKNDFRQNAQELSLENELLMNQMRQTETDTIDVVTFLKKEDQKKDGRIEQLETNLKRSRRQHRLEKQSLIDDFNTQINSLERKLTSKQEDIGLIQNELMHVKEFRKKRALMQRELDEIRDTMFLSNRDHKEESCRLEQKFLEERISLQKEADQKISELADRAHQEAMSNLDETTRVVYKENIALAEKLSESMKEEEALKKLNARLSEEHLFLVAEQDNNKAVIAKTATDSQRKASKLAELNSKVELLEGLLNHMIREFKESRRQLLSDCDDVHNQSRQKILRLQREVELKTKECSRVRKLARKILAERNEIERFFLESLQLVKEEILHNQVEYKKAAEKAYNLRMLQAFSGQTAFPKVRTFNKTETSTNSVFRDLEAAEMLAQPSGQVDIADLTWEQREKVLRYLFARMNGTTRPPLRLTDDVINTRYLKESEKLPITHAGDVAGNVEADPFYDNMLSTQQLSTKDHDDFSGLLNKHSVVPGIASRSQAVTA
ncbi:basal body-orientation factor 1-like [Watersipora subatra]|uniref:basal body-orientation factor 1-like n=1 Tax=Watersipora subatra TaxID=2589382 RepID=UPI00355AEF7E